MKNTEILNYSHCCKFFPTEDQGMRYSFHVYSRDHRSHYIFKADTSRIYTHSVQIGKLDISIEVYYKTT